MKLFIKPTIESIQKEMGYDDIDCDENYEELLVQQGYDMDIVDIEEGETFIIPENYVGDVTQGDETYYLRVRIDIDEETWDKEEINDDLPAGIYKLEGNVIIPEDNDWQ